MKAKNPFSEGTLYAMLFDIYTQPVAPSDTEIIALVWKSLRRRVKPAALYSFKAKLRSGAFPGMSAGIEPAAQRRSRG